jgi:hypothetical protein
MLKKKKAPPGGAWMAIPGLAVCGAPDCLADFRGSDLPWGQTSSYLDINIRIADK